MDNQSTLNVRKAALPFYRGIAKCPMFPKITFWVFECEACHQEFSVKAGDHSYIWHGRVICKNFHCQNKIRNEVYNQEGERHLNKKGKTNVNQ